MRILAVTAGQGFEPGAWRAVLRSGVDAFMVREPHLDARALLEASRWCRQEAPEVELWVNGRLDVALAVGAGLHAPEHHPEVPPGLLPCSRPLHRPEQFATRASARQLIVSPVFPVPGKGPALGAEGLRAWLDAFPPYDGRVLALGGIRPDTVAPLRHPRLDGVALLRALWETPDPAGLVARLRAAWGG